MQGQPQHDSFSRDGEWTGTAAAPPAGRAASGCAPQGHPRRLHAAQHGAPGLNTTALVHESFLRLAGRVNALQFQSRGHFYAFAARVMRSVIVDLVREQAADRRGRWRRGSAPCSA